MSEMMVRKQYTPEFKAEAMKLVLEQGYTCRQAGQQLGIECSMSRRATATTMRRWRASGEA